MQIWLPFSLKVISLVVMIIAVCCSRFALKVTLENIVKMQKEIPGKNPLVKQAQLNYYGIVIILALIVARLLEVLSDQTFVIFLTAALGVYGINLTKDKENNQPRDGGDSGKEK